ncbi:MAG: hypothetical protein U0174_22560 [Polyangiaceae bacterium]
MDKGASSRGSHASVTTVALFALSIVCAPLACTDYSGAPSTDSGEPETGGRLPSSDSGLSEGGVDASTGADGQTTGACNPDAPFGPAVPLTTLSPPAQGTVAGFSFTDDELRVYFAQGGVIYTASRASRASDFGDYTLVPAASVGTQARHPAVSRDGKTLTYALRSGTEENLVIASLPTPATLDKELALANDSGLSIRAPAPHPTMALTLLAITGPLDGPASGELVLWSSGHVSPLLAPSIAASAPVFDATGSRVYVGNSALVNGQKTRVISVLKGSGGTTFGTPTALPSFGTPLAPFPAWISSDQCRLYLWSGDTESGLPYIATRKP